MSMYDRAWSPESLPLEQPISIPRTTLDEASDGAWKSLITYLEAARKTPGVGMNNVCLKSCVMVDDRVIAGVRSTTFTATFRDVGVEEVVAEEKVERSRSASEKAGDEEGNQERVIGKGNIDERAHLAIRLFVGSGDEEVEDGKGGEELGGGAPDNFG